MAYEFVASGAADEHTLRWNREAFDRIRLRPRVLRDVADRRHPRGAARAGAAHSRSCSRPPPITASCTPRGNWPPRAVPPRRASRGSSAWAPPPPLAISPAPPRSPLWFQLYFQSDREFTRDVVQQAEAAGCEALCLTVDSPIIGARNRQARAGFRLPSDVTTPHLYDIGHRKQAIMDPRRVAATWKDVEWLRARHPAAGRAQGHPRCRAMPSSAIQAGAAGIIVSNHGARNLDTTPATIDALPEVAERVDGRVPLLVDGGIRRGTDVLKAIALGARAVLIGRPYCYGLSVAGSEGVRRVVEILRAELEAAMMLSGVAAIGAIDRACCGIAFAVTRSREGGPRDHRRPRPALHCRGLTKRYGDVAAVAGLDLEVRAGECFGMLGPNGAGKTTTVEIFEGLASARRGRASRCSAIAGTATTSTLRARLGIQLQETKFPEKLTGGRGRDAVPQLLSARARRSTTCSRWSALHEKAGAQVRTLSGGQKQRLSLGCALVGDPELLFLDEPTTGLDPQSRRQTWEIVEGLKARGRTVLLTTHYMEEAARLCDRVAVVDHGKVIALGTPRELIASLGAEHVDRVRGRRRRRAIDDIDLRGAAHASRKWRTTRAAGGSPSARCTGRCRRC